MRRSRFRVLIVGTVAALLLLNIYIYDAVTSPSDTETARYHPLDKEKFEDDLGEPDEVYYDIEGPIPDDEKKG